MRLDNAEFSEEQLIIAIQNSHRFPTYDEAFYFAQRIKNKIFEIDEGTDVSIIRDTDFSVEKIIKEEKKNEVSV